MRTNQQQYQSNQQSYQSNRPQNFRPQYQSQPQQYQRPLPAKPVVTSNERENRTDLCGIHKKYGEEAFVCRWDKCAMKDKVKSRPQTLNVVYQLHRKWVAPKIPEQSNNSNCEEISSRISRQISSQISSRMIANNLSLIHI